MNEVSAQIIHDVVEAASWPTTRSVLLEAGYKPEEIVFAGEELANLTGRDAPFALEDFS